MNTSQYFSHNPTTSSDPSHITISLHDGRWDMLTDRGVFSHKTLDAGTRVLLEKAEPPSVDGPILDLGCGWGPISIVWATREPGRDVWAVDINPRAREIAAENARTNGCAHVRVAAPEEVPGALRFAAIYSNPPIKVGKKVLHEMCERWLSTLLDGGAAHLVVSKHLGSDSLARWLDAQGWEVERTASQRGYRMLRVNT